ncbi:MAG TPA: hypothetical protein VF406_05415 [Thermodesulfobacteriota bacterium]
MIIPDDGSGAREAVLAKAGRAPGRTLRSAALAAVLATGGCAMVGQRDAPSTADLLHAAGFGREPADTSRESLAVGTTLPRSVVPQFRNGRLVYTYADPYGCVCVYVGTPENYQTFTRLHSETAMARAGRQATDDAGMDRNLMERDVWAPWLPE